MFHLDPNIDDIWDILTFGKSADSSQLVNMGEILLTIWQHHWWCIIEDIPWNTTHALIRLMLTKWKGDKLPYKPNQPLE
ncbi:hypothetical protein BCR42DRAFT_428987 [Absidia repens]|uniref:Uncharacterized protein n=1 Tax=Absidia repens TaxID=90262 RepID=A0A1X2HXZ6_9FUNG|nr:hypothetical protein BCR42DRAFT_428987 [Absidia repens]